MLIQDSKKYLTNPMLAMVPAIVYLVLQTYYIAVPYALGISLVVALVSEYFLRKTFNSRIYSIPYYMMMNILASVIVLWLIAHQWIENDYAYFVIGEVVMMLQLIGFAFARNYINANFFQERSFLAKALLNDYFLTLVIFRYALLFHVILLLVYKELVIVDNVTVNFIIHVVFPVFMILFFLIYQYFRTRHLTKKLQEEEWLPIVTEDGQVKGRIARAVSKTFKNKYMHPVVRVALISGNKLYLQERDSNYIVDPRKIDHPFEKYIQFKHEIEEAVQNCVKMRLGDTLEIEPEFISKYVFKTELTNRLIFLFAIRVDDECLIVKTADMKGKFWTVKQIDEDFGNQVFSECFEIEYEYLKHVILLEDADALLARV